MTPERATAYRALLSQALFDGDFYAVRGRQGDKAIANRFYNLIPLIADLKKADRAEENDMNTTEIGLRDQVAKLLADRIGHGLREKTESVAAEVVALLTAAGEAQPTAPAGVLLVPDKRLPDDGNGDDDAFNAGWNKCREAMLAAAPAEPVAEPIPMILLCPICGKQHIDAPETRDIPSGDGFAEVADWTNPPHRSHLCHACGCIWRPADVPTVGVERVETRGKADTWDVAAAPSVVVDEGQRQRVLDALADALGDAMDCTRVWSAWSYNTMGPDDFHIITNDDSRMAELVDAALTAALKQGE
ncbi:hypothetical protein [Lysobacter antibioticus]|uniref:Uncharacterized protein n=1 Tax=Lysobacter antibioticus TaxID=84531 RepID=A0A0S2F7C8_LYSAN|nr:hypothetical protein [Lysobacter antibioticus]ALN79465.1 hypothetical protein LA76x_1308 [Lysobacter antibioticus]